MLASTPEALADSGGLSYQAKFGLFALSVAASRITHKAPLTLPLNAWALSALMQLELMHLYSGFEPASAALTKS
jgi:hypothetical protein